MDLAQRQVDFGTNPARGLTSTGIAPAHGLDTTGVDTARTVPLGSSIPHPPVTHDTQPSPRPLTAPTHRSSPAPAIEPSLGSPAVAAPE
ncbi:hypothetical protein ACTWQO_41305, partial [Streptomyces sp. 4N124]